MNPKLIALPLAWCGVEIFYCEGGVLYHPRAKKKPFPYVYRVKAAILKNGLKSHAE